jgi:hypothetical protein
METTMNVLRMEEERHRPPRRWFTAWGWIYRPNSVEGVLLVLLTLAFCVQVFMAVDRHSHSVSDTLYGIFPFVVPALMMLNWVAGKTAQKQGEG